MKTAQQLNEEKQAILDKKQEEIEAARQKELDDRPENTKVYVKYELEKIEEYLEKVDPTIKATEHMMICFRPYEIDGEKQIIKHLEEHGYKVESKHIWHDPNSGYEGCNSDPNWYSVLTIRW